MLRQGYMIKYREKSKNDNERFKKQEEGYLLKLTRPLKPSSIKALSKEKMNKFIEDVLTDKKMASILYDSNAQKEINSSLKSIHYCQKQNRLTNLKKKINPISFVKRRSRKEAYVQMRTEIHNYEINKKNHVRDMINKNYLKYLKIKKDIPSFENEYINHLRDNRVNSFKRAYDNLKLKIDDNKGHTIETEYSSDQSPKYRTKENYYLFRNKYIDCSHTINLPSIKCDINDVYSRLYHNKVLLTSKTHKFLNNKKPKSRKPISLHKQSRKLRNNRELILSQKTLQPNPKIKLNLKNALKSNNGKEFTIKVTDKIFKKCLNKYSGGPDVIKNPLAKFEANNEDYKDDSNNNDKNGNINLDSSINFYELKDKATGNSYLHMATEGNYKELVKYFIEKGADMNKQNNEGNTPMHLALKNNNMELVEIFLENKARLDIPNNEGEIPFDFFTLDMKKKYGLETLLVINPAKRK